MLEYFLVSFWGVNFGLFSGAKANLLLVSGRVDDFFGSQVDGSLVSVHAVAVPQVVVCLLDAGVSVGREEPLCLAAQKGHHQARC